MLAAVNGRLQRLLAIVLAACIIITYTLLQNGQERQSEVAFVTPEASSPFKPEKGAEYVAYSTAQSTEPISAESHDASQDQASLSKPEEVADTSGESTAPRTIEEELSFSQPEEVTIARTEVLDSSSRLSAPPANEDGFSFSQPEEDKGSSADFISVGSSAPDLGEEPGSTQGSQLQNTSRPAESGAEFRGCAALLDSHESKPASYLTQSFRNGLVSFPRSGNTWTRIVFQRLTRIYSGSIYNDQQAPLPLVHNPGTEGVYVIKSHQPALT